ncbi:MAG: hypothetical protein NC338_02440 [Firmicutes bacterium]|nr:hypothetical protein [Bacillota bacterium]MCM1400692.1 hypothetical protein [Bacteroides sp.]MCM1476386.1 hypothetical protein [Bacteroides sp.]
MKSLVAVLLPALTALSAQAASPVAPLEPDTVVHFTRPSSVVITDNGVEKKVEITSDTAARSRNFEYVVNYDSIAADKPAISLPFVGNSLSAPSKTEVSCFSDAYVGFVLPYHAPQAIRTSWEIGIGNMLGYRYNLGKSGAAVGFGVGFGVKTMVIRRGMDADRIGDSLCLLPAPEGASDVRTSLTEWNFQLPVYYRQRIYRSLAFKISVIMNYNIACKAKSKYMLDGVHYTKKVEGLHQRIITPDFVFTLGTLDFGGVYVRWSPVSMFKSSYGPQISTLSVGMSIGF